MKKETKTVTIAKVNGQSIQIIDNGQKMVPVKPICDALGVASNNQIEKIKAHPILNSVNMIIISTGADEKQYEMICIPYKYIFGWLFSIDARKVKPEASEAVLKYQNECYDALYNHFILREEYLEQQNEALDSLYDELEEIKADFKYCKTRLSAKQIEISRIRNRSFEEWRMENAQQSLPFPESEEVVTTNEEE